MSLRFALVLAAATGSPALAELMLSSRTIGLDLVALSALPTAPQGQGETDFCSHLFLEAVTTPGGQDATGKGWHVTAELPFGDLTAVSFIGRAIPATSGACELLDGNVGFFSGDQLVALLYGTEADSAMVGRIKSFGEGGLRVLSGDIIPMPVADLDRTGTGIVALPLAADEPVCDGTGTVPNIYNLPIDQARERLIAAGWRPVPGPVESQDYSPAKDLAAAGVTEVEDCSGTGFGFCAYRYSGPAGELEVTTVGEGGEDGSLPAVVAYGVECR
jgi:hypothetical protein